MAHKFTNRQIIMLLTISVATFANAICVSLQAPFYPHEAEKKGCTATEYGLVFGIFELVVFLISPYYGKRVHYFGPKLLFNGGILTTGTSAIFFGLLDKVNQHFAFISLSFIIRIVEAAGNAAFVTASFTLVAKEFPDDVAKAFAIIETFFGFGLIVGPTVGGALFQLGGFATPFVVLGSILLLAAVATAFVLPVGKDKLSNNVCSTKFTTALKIPGVMISYASIVATSMSIVFLQATLEPHLRKFELSPVLLGLMFVINGGVYALTTPVWGWFCDKKTKNNQPDLRNAKIGTIAGCLLVVTAFLLIGPAPFIPYDTLLSVTIVGLIIHGFGMSAQLVASFTDALHTSINNGLPDNVDTYGLISGLWTSGFALGAFVGPSVAGVLVDYAGFRNASMFIVIVHAIVGAIALAFLISTSRRRKHYVQIMDKEDYYTLPSENISHQDKTQNMSFDRVSGMNSLLACGSCSSYSYKATSHSRI